MSILHMLCIAFEHKGRLLHDNMQENVWQTVGLHPI